MRQSADGSGPGASHRIDVLVPHYNAADSLFLTLRSVAAQNCGETLRIVVADDGSEPAEIKAIRGFLETFSLPVILVENGVNRGRPYTRNVLLDCLESHFAAWLDAGDEWYLDKLRLQMAKLSALDPAEPAWITCNFDWQWDGHPLDRRYQDTSGDQVLELLRGKTLRAYLWTILGRAETFRNVGWFDSRLPRLQDLDFFIRFLLKGGRLHMPDTSDSLCVYHKSDIGRDADQVRACHQVIFDKHRALYSRYGRKFVAVQLYNMDIHAARFAAKNGDATTRRRYLLRAFARRPKQFVRRMLAGELPRRAGRT